jgi:CRP-like cAMP-binding protein
MTASNLRIARSNRLLANLPRAAFDRIVPDLRLTPLATREMLQKRGEPVDEVIFPVNGVASMVSMGATGDSVEVATIGCEGMVGLPLFLGGDAASVEVFVQVPGEGLRLPAAQFKHHVARERSLLQTLLRYTQALLTQIAQCSACNVYHTIEARCARWLLQTHDRVNGDRFQLTQEFLGLMLGVRRASVTEAAQALQRRKLIRYVRGIIEVSNRKGLEAAACECYQLINNEYERLLASRKRRAASAE